MHLDFSELLRYTQEERDKWRTWFAARPDALAVEVQPGGRYPTVGTLIDHIFLVERRHLQRLTDAPLDAKTGLSGHHAPPSSITGRPCAASWSSSLRTLTRISPTSRGRS